MRADVPELTTAERTALLHTLASRFESNMHRHPGIQWSAVQARLDTNPDALRSLNEMENTGGEPDVVTLGGDASANVFVDCAAQSPKGRRSVCYDRAALDARKENKPKDNALDMAARYGAELLTEAEYRTLQTLGQFDTTTSSWIQTPPKIRALGGALFCDRRYDTVFVYHNGAESYYAARGFRCALRLPASQQTVVDDYMDGFPSDVRARLADIRALVRDLAPDATEKISYGLPTFQLGGNLVHFGAFKHHIGLYPASSGIAAFADELKAYKSSKGAVQFPHDKPLPLDLIARMVALRVAECREKNGK